MEKKTNSEPHFTGYLHLHPLCCLAVLNPSSRTHEINLHTINVGVPFSCDHQVFVSHVQESNYLSRKLKIAVLLLKPVTVGVAFRSVIKSLVGCSGSEMPPELEMEIKKSEC